MFLGVNLLSKNCRLLSGLQPARILQALTLYATGWGFFIPKYSLERLSLMNAKQKKFCDEYLIDCNATQAAIRAGYSEKTANEQGNRLLANVSIKAYIDEQLERMHNEKTADAQEILEYLTSVLRGESSSSVLSLCGDGCQTVVEKPPDEKERLKAAELIGKRYGMFKDNIDVGGAIPVVISGGDMLED